MEVVHVRRGFILEDNANCEDDCGKSFDLQVTQKPSNLS